MNERDSTETDDSPAGSDDHGDIPSAGDETAFAFQSETTNESESGERAADAERASKGAKLEGAETEADGNRSRPSDEPDARGPATDTDADAADPAEESRADAAVEPAGGDGTADDGEAAPMDAVAEWGRTDNPAIVADDSTADASTVDLSDPSYYLHRELSELVFQCRVLHELSGGDSPLLERVRFLAIVTTNLDEFFRKRVGGLKQGIAAGVTEKTPDGCTPHEQWKAVLEVARPLLERQAERARDGEKARIVAKMNRLEDPEIVRELYEASIAGVDTRATNRQPTVTRYSCDPPARMGGPVAGSDADELA
ncbi:hypothetical protein [Natrinema gelatinilyticum]|uniref:hypothetical protein n=1 Tax=Natrinema gelatinilyticum TaxID=2961571 RepID=UPI0020C5ABFC|nr:hypothetical protein [Natrinema gelatinilyticum]